MTTPRSRWLLLAACWVVYLLGCAAWVATAAGVGAMLAGVVPQGLLVVCGTIIVLRTDVRAIGWLLALPGALILLLYPLGMIAPESVGRQVTVPGQQTLLALAPLVLWPLFHAVILFPTGRLRTRADHWLARGVAVVLVGASAVTAATSGATLADTAGQLAMVSFIGVLMIAMLVSRVRRYRRAPRVEQLQMKWFLVAIAGFLLYPVIWGLGLSAGWFQAADAVSTSLWPVTIMIAITRYRLYEIDRIVSRTLAYTVVLAVLGALFVGGVTGVTALLPTQDNLAVAATTVLVMALAAPLARRVRDLVDRRFDRHRYQARQVVEQFGHTVASVADHAAVRRQLHDVLATTLAPTTISVWEPGGSATSPD